ncbi:ATP-binding protein [Proteiniphilum sp.]|uniref:AAA family ATPase n=1 Tax=Proteiniphilum sp. TaxID=1926877 RepID=UPI00331CE442
MNPFLLNNYLGPDYFCDRQEETEILLKNIHNLSNTAVFSQRRIGKTALMKHVFYLLKKTQSTIYLDIFPTSSLKEFTDYLATAIYKEFPIHKSIGRKFWEHIKLLRPVLKINALSGEPELTLDISQTEQIEKSLPQLFSFLDQQEKKVVIAIDEFQQILLYPEKNVEALLRTIIQNLHNISFIFLGSDSRLMIEIFNSTKRPFYGSTNFMTLKKIPKGEYVSFIKNSFHAVGVKMDEKIPEMILSLTCGHTYYTQRLCHEIYADQITLIREKEVKETLYKLVQQNEAVYFQYRNLLTKTQWKTLKAVTSEEMVYKPYSQEFIKKHDLGSTSTLKRNLEALVDKAIIYHNLSVEEPYYEVEDKFLMRWLQNE